MCSARVRARRASRRRPGARRCAGAAAARPGSGSAEQQVDQRAQARRVVDVAGAVRGDEHVLAGLDARRRAAAASSSRARGWKSMRDVDHHVADELDARRRRARARGCSTGGLATSTAAGRDRWSVRTRLSSSGIAPVERAHAGLDVGDRDVAPAPRPGRRRASSSCRRRRARRRARSSAISGPSAASMRAVCSVFVPPWMSSSRSGRGHAELLDEDRATARRRSAGRCGRAARRARSRSSRETAAALTNCGRLPMTVTTFTRERRRRRARGTPRRPRCVSGPGRRRQRERRRSRGPAGPRASSRRGTPRARRAGRRG